MTMGGFHLGENPGWSIGGKGGREVFVVSAALVPATAWCSSVDFGRWGNRWWWPCLGGERRGAGVILGNLGLKWGGGGDSSGKGFEVGLAWRREFE